MHITVDISKNLFFYEYILLKYYNKIMAKKINLKIRSKISQNQRVYHKNIKSNEGTYLLCKKSGIFNNKL